MKSASLKIPFFVAFLSLLGGVESTMAQDGKVSLRFITFPPVTKPETFHLAVAGGGAISIEAGSRSFSQPVSVTAQEKWSVVESPANETRKEEPKVLGQAPSLPVDEQLIILLRKGRNPEDGYSMVVVPDPSGGDTGGSVMFFNLSAVKLSGLVGGKRFLLKSREHIAIKPKLSADGRNFQSRFAHHLGKKPKMFYASTWPGSERAAMFVFFFHDPSTRRLTLHSVVAGSQ
jgi:hypothetical protein